MNKVIKREFAAFDAKDCAEKLKNIAKENKKTMIIAHRNPDGDAVGSAFALKLILESLGTQAFCACTGNIPDYLRFLLRGQEDIKFSENCKYDTIITVDTASPGQMGDLEHLSDKVYLAIDHHESCTPYCDEYRDKDASAAGEMVFNIYEYLVENKDISENADICRLIYAAISADSGSFMYSNTTEKTHITASKLIRVINNDKNGINSAEISRLLHNSKSLANLKAQMKSIEALTVCDDGKIAYILLSKEITECDGLKDEDFASSVDIPRSVDGVLLAFVMKECKNPNNNGKKFYRLSTRSSCEISVAEICKKFGGGGHAKAAGGSIEADSEKEALEAVLCAFRDALKGN